MVCYFYYVADSLALVVIGAAFVVKALVEIWGQETPTWLCPGNVCQLLFIYVVGLPTIVSMMGYCRMATDINFRGRDILGLLLYFGGSAYSLAYEVSRFRWKARPENKGKLHTVGQAAYCIHPNYFGDLFTYTGWGLAVGTSCTVSLPIAMVPIFVFLIMPNSDAYLAQRYPQEFPAYAAKTATLIPGLHSTMASKLLSWICLAVAMYCWCFTCGAPCGY